MKSGRIKVDGTETRQMGAVQWRSVKRESCPADDGRSFRSRLEVSAVRDANFPGAARLFAPMKDRHEGKIIITFRVTARFGDRADGSCRRFQLDVQCAAACDADVNMNSGVLNAQVRAAGEVEIDARRIIAKDLI